MDRGEQPGDGADRGVHGRHIFNGRQDRRGLWSSGEVPRSQGREGGCRLRRGCTGAQPGVGRRDGAQARRDQGLRPIQGRGRQIRRRHGGEARYSHSQGGERRGGVQGGRHRSHRHDLEDPRRQAQVAR